MTIETVIEARDLVVAYGEKVILRGVSTSIPRGSVTCVVGGSGCGKSTLLRAALGLVPPRAGSIRLLGEDMQALEGEARAAFLGKLGFMYQNGALLNSISVYENLAIPLRAHTDLPPDVVDEIIHFKLGQVQLSHAVHLLPSELSGGMRKRAGFARAMVLDPEVILCDEPSAGLDPITAADLDVLLLRLRAELGITLVVVTHDLDSIKRIADRVVMLDAGRVRFDGALEAAMACDDAVVHHFFAREANPPGAASAALLSQLRESPGEVS